MWATVIGFSIVVVETALAADLPVIHRMLPGALCPGKVTEVTVRGEHLSEVTRVWTSFACKCEVLSTEENGKTIKCRMTVPRDQQVGIGAIRVATKNGVSGARLIMLDDMASLTEAENNHSLQTAQEIELPVVIDGTTDPRRSDFFKMNVTAGDRLSAEIVADRLGSRLDSVLRLLNSDGEELAFSDDRPGVLADSRWSYEFGETGVVYIELRDVRHEGSVDHYYRLRLGDFPLLAVAFPLGGAAGSITTFTLAGPYTGPLAPVTLLLPDDGHPRKIPLSTSYRSADGSGFVNVRVASGPESVEIEPNDQQPSATPITVPCAINGRFEQPGDTDYFKFTAAKGARLVFTGHTRTLGAPSDLYLRLLNQEGTQLVEVEDAGRNEGVVDYTFADEGDYFLAVEDLLHEASPTHVYRIEVEPFRPRFELSVEPETLNVPHGGTFVSQVVVTRSEYTGPIELSVEGAGSDLKLSGHTIASDAKTAALKVTLPERIQPGELHMVRIVGTAKIDDKTVMSQASTLSALRKMMRKYPFPPAVLDGQIALAVGPRFPPFFEISIQSGAAYFGQRVGSSTFKVLLNRLDEQFTDSVAVSIEGLPEGITAEVEPIEKGKSETTVIQNGPENLEAGVHQIRVIATGTFENQTKTVVLDEVPLYIIEPLRVTLKPKGPLQPGGNQRVTVCVQRFGEEKHPVRVSWKQAPPEILVPLEIMIPPDKSEVDIELAATSGAVPKTSAELVVEATTMVKDEEVTVESAPVALTIAREEVLPAAEGEEGSS